MLEGARAFARTPSVLLLPAVTRCLRAYGKTVTVFAETGVASDIPAAAGFDVPFMMPIAMIL